MNVYSNSTIEAQIAEAMKPMCEAIALAAGVNPEQVEVGYSADDPECCWNVHITVTLKRTRPTRTTRIHKWGPSITEAARHAVEHYRDGIALGDYKK